MFLRNVRNILLIASAMILLAIVLGNAFFSINQNVTGRQASIDPGLKDDLGAAPIVYAPAAGILQGNNTRAVFLWYSTCQTCDENDRNLYISESYPTWQGNLTSSEVTFSTMNYYRKTEAGEAYFRTFNIPENMKGGTFLVVHNSKVGLVYYPPFKDSKIRQGVYYITRGSLEENIQKSSVPRLSQPLVYVLGAVSGFNPCLIALTSFFFAASTKTELRAVAKRIGLISVGLIYAYTVFFSLVVSNQAVMSSLASITWIIVFALVVMGLLHFVEVAHDIYSRRWGSGSSIEAKMPLFKTPRPLKEFLVRVRESNSPAYDFALGAVFSLIKLPCIAAFLIVLLINSTSPLMDVVIFTFGVVSPIILMGALIGLGMIKVNRLSAAQFKGRLIQRTIIGIALLASAFLVVA